MTTKSTVTYTGLTYSELLATFPWVALMPPGQSMTCQWGYTTYGRGKSCKTAARLLYINLDGTIQYFCHHHLYTAKMSDGYTESGEPGHEEVVRNKEWQKRSSHIDRRPN